MSLYRRRDSPYWWSSLFVAGRRHAESTGERNRSAALRREREIAARLDARRAPASGLTLRKAAVELLARKEATARAGTLSMLTKHVRAIVGHFGDVPVKGIDVEAIRAWLKSLDVSPVTSSKMLSTLRQILAVAVDLGVLERNPCPRGPRVRLSSKAWRILSRDELTALLAALQAGRGLEAAIWYLVAADTGMRPAEQQRVEWAWIDERAGLIRLPASATKTGERRDVRVPPMARAALDVLAAWRGPHRVGNLWTQRDHRTALAGACARAGIGRLRPYDLRHTFASLLHADGAPLVVIRDALGHTTLTMVNHYAHSLDADRIARIDRASVGAPVTVGPATSVAKNVATNPGSARISSPSLDPRSDPKR